MIALVKVVRQEAKQEEEEAAGTGEHLCHLSAYNRRLEQSSVS